MLRVLQHAAVVASELALVQSQKIIEVRLALAIMDEDMEVVEIRICVGEEVKDSVCSWDGS